MKPVVCLCLCAFVLCGASVRRRKSSTKPSAPSGTEITQTAAARGFQSVLREQPRNIAALSNLGVIYSRTNRADRAIAAYRRALQVSPDDTAILLNLGLVYLRQESHSKALPLFERIVAIDPRHLQARQSLAVCRAYAGQLTPAIRDLESLRAAAPRDERWDSLSAGFRLPQEPRPGKREKCFPDDVRGGRPQQYEPNQ